MRLGHGGAFAFLPNPETSPLDIKYRIQSIDLGAELSELWRWHCRLWTATRAQTSQVLDIAEGKRVRVHQWLERLDSLGRLSATDGCVVFDRELKVHGFGGEINNDLSCVSPLRCFDLTTEQDLQAEELLRPYDTGTSPRTPCAARFQMRLCS